MQRPTILFITIHASAARFIHTRFPGERHVAVKRACCNSTTTIRRRPWRVKNGRLIVTCSLISSDCQRKGTGRDLSLLVDVWEIVVH
ncbi:hypothetical protein DAI22_11g137300 [Oryza sativa Japonica Group]|nr:hypothetical protein DAI22_11g137300 [Oryza sativa Japonica Group]